MSLTGGLPAELIESRVAREDAQLGMPTPMVKSQLSAEIGRLVGHTPATSEVPFMLVGGERRRTSWRAGLGSRLQGHFVRREGVPTAGRATRRALRARRVAQPAVGQHLLDGRSGACRRGLPIPRAKMYVGATVAYQHARLLSLVAGVPNESADLALVDATIGCAADPRAEHLRALLALRSVRQAAGQRHAGVAARSTRNPCSSAST